MEIWDDDLPDTPEVHGDGGSAPSADEQAAARETFRRDVWPAVRDVLGDSAPSRAAQLDARDEDAADDDFRSAKLVHAWLMNDTCVGCGFDIDEHDLMAATLVSVTLGSPMRLAHEGECSAAAFKANGRVTGKYGARGMRGLKIGRAES